MQCSFNEHVIAFHFRWRLVVKNSSANAADIRDVGLILIWEDPRGGHGNPPGILA